MDYNVLFQDMIKYLEENESKSEDTKLIELRGIINKNGFNARQLVESKKFRDICPSELLGWIINISEL